MVGRAAAFWVGASERQRIEPSERLMEDAMTEQRFREAGLEGVGEGGRGVCVC